MFWEKIIDKFYIFKQKSFENLKDFFHYLHIRVFIGLIFFVNSLIWLLARFILNRIDSPQMALHYNVDAGINYYGNSKNIFIIPFLGFLIFFINLVLYLSIGSYRDRVFFSYLLFSVALFANIILLAGISSVYLVNFK